MEAGELRMTRRGLLQAAGILGVPCFVPVTAVGGAARPAPSRQVTMGLIGLGSMGMRHIDGFLQENDCRILAVCDVDTARRNAARDKVNAAYGNRDCTAYNDFRELIARMDIDTLCIAVPDHWHAVLALEGIRAGKDIYGEKPLARTIPEGRRLVNAVRRYGCIWQTGSWQRSTEHFRFACELVRNERIGRLLGVEVGIGGGFMPLTGPRPVDHLSPQPPQPVPAGFDYDFWLGPAPWVPYTAARCHWNFRWILDYSGGQVTDWGAHHIDIAHWGMGCDETGPLEVEGTAVFPPDGLWDAAVDYDFTCRYAGGLTMRVASNNHLTQGVRFLGERGWVHVTRGGLQTHPAELRRTVIGADELRLPRPAGNERQGHRRDFLDCVKARAGTISSVETGHRSVIPAHLANIAMILGRKVRWDPQNERILDDEPANRMLDRPLRSPWRL
jgi:predicted dehydrogenase